MEYYHFNDFNIFFNNKKYENLFCTKTSKSLKTVTEYVNLPVSFDIETTNFNNNDRISFMYIWAFCFDGNVFYGRTWEDFIDLLKDIKNTLQLYNGKRYNKKIIIYVHNLSFEFQFMKKYIEFENVFFTEERKVLKAEKDCFEFRCSQFLSGLKLEYTSKLIKNYNIEKLVGNLDYSKIRHSETIIDDKEIEYLKNDVLIVNYYIREKIDEEKQIFNIPLTKTSYVRRYCRNNTIIKNNHYNMDYKKIINKLTVELDEMKLLNSCFSGGFNHSSSIYSYDELNFENDQLGEYDIVSSYPNVLCSEKFPMSKGEKIDISKITSEDFNKYLKYYNCIFRISFSDLEEKDGFEFEHFISTSKCEFLEDYEEDNGRIVKAKKVTIVLNEVDFKIINHFYKYDKNNIEISDLYIYKKDYLPRELIECILHFYYKKNNENDKIKREVSKTMLNSIFGMICTHFLRDKITWNKEDCSYYIKSIEEMDDNELLEIINKYNKDENRFLFYPWAIYVTSYAKQRLFSLISEMKYDYIYSDTDSIKCRNYKSHVEFIEKFNNRVNEKLMKCLKYRNIEYCEYLDNFGKFKFKGEIEFFKTLGCKRYIQKKNGIWELTVAGVGKEKAMEYIKMISDNKDQKIITNFNSNLIIPSNYTDKLTLLYVDDEKSGIIEDYNGKISTYESRSYVYMEPCKFSMCDMSQINYFLNIKLIDK